jgi:hypothetical protein
MEKLGRVEENILYYPDDVNPDNIKIDGKNKTIQILNEPLTLCCLYSYLKDVGSTADGIIVLYPFPLLAISPWQMEFQEGWRLYDKESLGLLREGILGDDAFGCTDWKAEMERRKEWQSLKE